MEITGRLTANAEVKTLRDDRQVVNFTVVFKEYYKNRGGEKKEIATFFNCSYWVSTKVAANLKKGTIVLLYGRVGVNVWKNMDGEPKASLVFHVNNIKFIGGGKPNAATIETATTAATANEIPAPETADDLPF